MRPAPRDWFERLTGFAEQAGPAGYAATQAQLEVNGERLRSRVNGREYGIGRLELVSLQALRQRAQAGPAVPGQPGTRVLRGDVRAMHQRPELAGALFQVASQFNLLEMVGPQVTPEHGVGRYAGDPTQGPACAMAAGAATIYRNYLVPVGDQIGQTESCQLDGFAALGNSLAQSLECDPQALWTMRNGYALFKLDAVRKMSAAVAALDDTQRDALKQLLCIGLHWDVEVTDSAESPGPHVSQAFCSALPISYNQHGHGHWAPLASLVLEASYEATLWAAVINAQEERSRTVLLTSVGGGVFGNEPAWIEQAVQRAVDAVSGYGLDVVTVRYR